MDDSAEVRRLCDVARQHLHEAWRALSEAQVEASRGGDTELAKTLHTTSQLASGVGQLCITLPRLNG